MGQKISIPGMGQKVAFVDPHKVQLGHQKLEEETDGVESKSNGCPFLAATAGVKSFCSPLGSSTVSIHQQIITTTKRELTAKEIAEHPLLPKRDGVDEKEFGGKITWRNGKKGDYTKANAKYLNERIGRWNSPDCLEHVVSNLIKTLEMELTKKSDPQQWVCSIHVHAWLYAFQSRGLEHSQVSMASEVFKYRGTALLNIFRSSLHISVCTLRKRIHRSDNVHSEWS